MTRRFRPDPLPAELVVRLCDLARRAPSAGFSQGTHFVVLLGDDVGLFWRTTGAERWFRRKAPGVLDAPAIVLPCGDPAAYTDRYQAPDKASGGEVAEGLRDEARWPVPYWLTDTAMATENLLLLAEEHGLGALLFGIFRNERELLDSLGVPGHVRALGAVALGRRADDDRPTGSPTRHSRRPVEQVVHLGRWAPSLPGAPD